VLARLWSAELEMDAHFVLHSKPAFTPQTMGDLRLEHGDDDLASIGELLMVLRKEKPANVVF